MDKVNAVWWKVDAGYFTFYGHYYQGKHYLNKNQVVRAISFPGSSPICSRCVRALTTFQGLTRVSVKWPACGMGLFGAGPRCMMSPQEGEWLFDLALVKGSPEWSPRGRQSKAPMVKCRYTDPSALMVKPTTELGKTQVKSPHISF